MSEKKLSEQIKEANYPEIDYTKIYAKHTNKFLLSVVVSKRARQISEGSKALLDYYPDEPFNPMLLALKELELGKFTYTMEENYSEEDNMIEQMDKSLDEEISKENEPPQSTKETKKPKSKSLAI